MNCGGTSVGGLGGKGCAVNVVVVGMNVCAGCSFCGCCSCGVNACVGSRAGGSVN